MCLEGDELRVAGKSRLALPQTRNAAQQTPNTHIFFLTKTVLFYIHILNVVCGDVAQLGAHMTGSHGVRGSIPLISTNYKAVF